VGDWEAKFVLAAAAIRELEATMDQMNIIYLKKVSELDVRIAELQESFDLCASLKKEAEAQIAMLFVEIEKLKRAK